MIWQCINWWSGCVDMQVFQTLKVIHLYSVWAHPSWDVTLNFECQLLACLIEHVSVSLCIFTGLPRLQFFLGPLDNYICGDGPNRYGGFGGGGQGKSSLGPGLIPGHPLQIFLGHALKWASIKAMGLCSDQKVIFRVCLEMGLQKDNGALFWSETLGLQHRHWLIEDTVNGWTVNTTICCTSCES